jgi:Glycosyltransferase family 9 (heptosyltransferase)
LLSCALREWHPLLRLPEIAFYSLQKGEWRRELAELPPEIRLTDLELSLVDFGDLALLLDQLDLVITVDTAAAHLAGALGKPTWVLLSDVPDWRWQLEGEQTRWYPTMRLFRQARPGDWSGVIQRVVLTLSEQMGSAFEVSAQRDAAGLAGTGIQPEAFKLEFDPSPPIEGQP